MGNSTFFLESWHLNEDRGVDVAQRKTPSGERLLFYVPHLIPVIFLKNYKLLFEAQILPMKVTSIIMVITYIQIRNMS